MPLALLPAINCDLVNAITVTQLYKLVLPYSFSVLFAVRQAHLFLQFHQIPRVMFP